MSTDLYTVTSGQLRHAERRLARAEAAWNEYIRAEVDPATLAEQRAAVARLGSELQRLRGDARACQRERLWQWLKVGALWRWLQFWVACQWPYAGVLLVLSGVLFSLCAGLCVGAAVELALGLLIGFINLCLLSLLVVAWFCLHGDPAGAQIVRTRAALPGAEQELLRATTSFKRAQEVADRCDARWRAASATYEKMLFLNGLRDSYREARRKYQRLFDIVQSLQYQLLHCDWRAMRGTEFENFLQRVFEALGYMVQTTKASGDQGLDLILMGKGRRIGVQAKGYSGNVGNHAVMEANAGMGFYQCDCCVVITNSDFTRTAKELASSLGCRLIAGDEIPNLIRGNIAL